MRGWVLCAAAIGCVACATSGLVEVQAKSAEPRVNGATYGADRVDVDLGSTGHIDRTITYIYDARGRLSESHFVQGENRVDVSVSRVPDGEALKVITERHDVFDIGPTQQEAVRRDSRTIDHYGASGLMESQCLIDNTGKSCTDFIYDEGGRLIRQESQGDTVNFRYELDAAGRVVTMTARRAEHEINWQKMTYDERGRVMAIELTIAPKYGPGKALTTFEYDRQDRMILRRFKNDSAELSLSYHYHRDGRLDRIEGDLGISSDCFDKPWQPKARGMCFALGQGQGKATMVYGSVQ